MDIIDDIVDFFEFGPGCGCVVGVVAFALVVLLVAGIIGSSSEPAKPKEKPKAAISAPAKTGTQVDPDWAPSW
jgi:hypothetical protein